MKTKHAQDLKVDDTFYHTTRANDYPNPNTLWRVQMIEPLNGSLVDVVAVNQTGRQKPFQFGRLVDLEIHN